MRAFALPSTVGARLRASLPIGVPLDDADWQARHRVVSFLAWAHLPLAALFLATSSEPLEHAFYEVPPLVALAAIASRSSSRKVAEAAATLSLLGWASLLVHLTGGTIEFHFHFFVMVGLVTLYEQWRPFLLAVAYVLAHHGVVGVLQPEAVYNHPDAIAHPVRWTLLHAAYITIASGVGVAAWRFNERTRLDLESGHLERRAHEAIVREELQGAVRLRDTLVSSVSHEFRTPVTVIEGFANTLVAHRDDLTSAEVDDYLARISAQSRRLRDVTENLLLTAFPPGRVAASYPASLCIRSIVDDLTPAAAARRISWAVDIDGQAALPMEQRTADRVIRNLLANALNHADDDTAIDVSARVIGDDVAVRVSNRGPEIPLEHRRRIFDPFVQVDDSLTRQVDGIGLGLAVVARTVATCQGRIHVDCERGRTTFEVLLPRPRNGQVANVLANGSGERSRPS